MEKIFKKNKDCNEKGIAKIDKNVPMLDEDLFSPKNPDQDKVNVKVLNSSQKSQLYHFKVMKLRNHEDRTKEEIDDGEYGSNCEVLFHFFFELLKKKKQSNDKDKFEWDINENPQ